MAAVGAIARLGSSFLPEFHEGSLTVQANTLPGTSLAKSDEIGRRVEQILLAQPEVIATARRTGRAEFDEHVQGVEAAEIDVGLRETARPRAELLADLRRGFSTLPGTNVTIGQPISHRIDHMLSGHAREHRREGVRRRSRHAQAARGARARGHEPRARCRGPVARTADGHSVRALRPEPAGHRALRVARGRCRRSDRDELSRERTSAGSSTGHRVRSGRQVRLRRAGRLRSHRRSAGGHARRRRGAGSAAGRRPARGRAEHDPARERAAPDRDLRQRRRPRSGKRRRRHPVGRGAVGRHAGRLPRRVWRAVRERAERVAAPAGARCRRRRRGCS